MSAGRGRPRRRGQALQRRDRELKPGLNRVPRPGLSRDDRQALRRRPARSPPRRREPRSLDGCLAGRADPPRPGCGRNDRLIWKKFHDRRREDRAGWHHHAAPGREQTGRRLQRSACAPGAWPAPSGGYASSACRRASSGGHTPRGPASQPIYERPSHSRGASSGAASANSTSILRAAVRPGTSITVYCSVRCRISNPTSVRTPDVQVL